MTDRVLNCLIEEREERGFRGEVWMCIIKYDVNQHATYYRLLPQHLPFDLLKLIVHDKSD
jgi:hypothetical protein